MLPCTDIPPRRVAHRAGRRLGVWTLAGLLVAASAAWAQPSDTERAQRRMQQQVQALQQQLQAAQVAKTQLETERDTMTQKLAAEARATARARQALRQSETARQALEQERGALQTRVAALDTQATEQKRSAEEALAARDRDLAQRTRTHDVAVQGWRTRLLQQTELLTDCSAKNQSLLALGAELSRRYRDQTVAEVLKKREPVLGFGELKLYEEMQVIRDRSDAERFDPNRPVAPPAAAAAESR